MSERRWKSGNVSKKSKDILVVLIISLILQRETGSGVQIERNGSTTNAYHIKDSFYLKFLSG